MMCRRRVCALCGHRCFRFFQYDASYWTTATASIDTFVLHYNVDVDDDDVVVVEMY